MHLKFRNCNDAFQALVEGIHLGTIHTKTTGSRDGQVKRITEPVMITYQRPRERVLFNTLRNCNPFFHLFESLWMLAGRNDLAPLVYYNKQMAQYSDDGGKTQPAAYGNRWRVYFGWDQLNVIVKELKDNPASRRVVLAMWDPMALDDDLYRAINGSVDIPCNTHAYFDIQDGALVMTVCNRSNDLVWGMLGANVVHFSILQEYLARRIGVEVGPYHQFTNNLHVYTERWEPKKWLSYGDKASRTMWDPQVCEYANDLEDQTVNGGVLASPPVLNVDYKIFDEEVKKFVDDPFKDWREPFLDQVAKPMCQAFRHHKARQYDLAFEATVRIQGQDWQAAARNWLIRQKQLWEKKQDEYNNPYRAKQNAAEQAEGSCTNED